MGHYHGPNFNMYENITRHSNINIIVSGGIKDSDNIYKVAELNYYGCIVGTKQDAIDFCDSLDKEIIGKILNL